RHGSSRRGLARCPQLLRPDPSDRRTDAFWFPGTLPRPYPVVTPRPEPSGFALGVPANPDSSSDCPSLDTAAGRRRSDNGARGRYDPRRMARLRRFVAAGWVVMTIAGSAIAGAGAAPPAAAQDVGAIDATGATD